MQEASKDRRLSQMLASKFRDSRMKAVGPTLGALVMLSQLVPGLAITPELLEEQRLQTQLDRKGLRDDRAALETSAGDAKSKEDNRGFMASSSAHSSMNPMSVTPYGCSKAPEFQESRSRMTLAERARAATADRQ